MLHVGSNEAEMKTATLKSVHSHENNSLAYSKDHFEKFKEEYCWEFQRGQLKYFNSDNPDNSTTTTVVKIEKRRGTNMLILRCGPKGRMVFFLEFDSKKLTDEWQEAICQFTGQPYDPSLALRRVKSDLKEAAAKYRTQRSLSAFPDIVIEQVDDVSPQGESSPDALACSDAPGESPSSPPVTMGTMVAPPSPSEELLGVPSYSSLGSGSGETDDSDDGTQNASRPSSLRSRDADISPSLVDLAKKSTDKEFDVSDLHQVKFKDYKGDVVVQRPVPCCQLHTGDIVVVKNKRGLLMNARELTEHIRTSPEQSTIVLTIVRGPVCVVRVEESELSINIKDSQMVSVNPVDAITQACASACSIQHDGNQEESKLMIAEIDQINMDTFIERDQITEKVKEELEISGFLTLRLVPESLLNSLNTSEADDDGS